MITFNVGNIFVLNSYTHEVTTCSCTMVVHNWNCTLRNLCRFALNPTLYNSNQNDVPLFLQMAFFQRVENSNQLSCVSTGAQIEVVVKQILIHITIINILNFYLCRALFIDWIFHTLLGFCDILLGRKCLLSHESDIFCVTLLNHL